VATIAHSVVSNAGTIGATALSDAARQLQMAVDADERSLWPALAEEFSREHVRVMAALAARFNAMPPSASTEP
jgi:HPt (histidine-containing phosphotransfer) domain-containing protein